MRSINFIQEVISKHYAHFDEERKRNISIGIILNLMMLIVMGSWIVGFWILNMEEIFWVDLFLWSGYVLIYFGLVKFGMSYEIWRFIALAIAGAITAIPSLFYGFETCVTLHMVFLPIAMILLFARTERRTYFHYMVAAILTFFTVAYWGLTYGPMYQLPAEIFRLFNIIIAIDCLFISLYISYFFFTENSKYKTLLANEREKSDHLLLSIFPESIADQLRNSHQSVADTFDNVTILFADIVGFTKYAGSKSASELVAMLDEVFSEFDKAVDKYGIEKIKTIGDAYMAVGGLPDPDARHCQNVALMALEINQVIKEKFRKKYDLQIRIGIHTGKAVAGVIGNKKFSYDLWGDSVNIASRFESSGHPEKIHVSQDVKDLLEDEFTFEDCGEILIKGKGMMQSYFLTGHQPVDQINETSNDVIIAPSSLALSI